MPQQIIYIYLSRAAANNIYLSISCRSLISIESGHVQVKGLLTTNTEGGRGALLMYVCDPFVDHFLPFAVLVCDQFVLLDFLEFMYYQNPHNLYNYVWQL